MTTRKAWPAAGAAAVLWICSAAFGQTMVSACGNDVALRAAVAVGGAISFSCGQQPTVIDIASSIAVDRPAQIDGGGRVTLRGSGTAPLFVAKSPLTLTGLTVLNPAPAAFGIVSSTSAVSLRAVQTRETAAAYVAQALDAQESRFEANGRSADAPGVVVNAERVRISKSVFRNNLDHPVGGGTDAAARKAVSREVQLDDVTFEGNRASVLAIDATLTVRNSRFTGNGTPPSADTGPWMCCGGAITAIASRVEVHGSEFKSNGSQGAGGAIQAIASDLRIATTHFEGNRARAGGAVFSWARPVKQHWWSAQPPTWPLQPRLRLDRVRFHENAAQLGGGALVWAGLTEGDHALFAKNTAPVGGAAAHVSALTLPSEFGSIFTELDALTVAVSEDLRLARGVFAENRARTRGAAVHGGASAVALGSGLLLRNVIEVPGDGAALESAGGVELANVTIADNEAGGVALLPGPGRAEVRNTIVLRNVHYGCRIPASAMQSPTTNLQFPANDCPGAALHSPALGANYKPASGSHASLVGDIETCLAGPLVVGVDLAGATRGARGICAAGAYEADPLVDAITGWSFPAYPWLRWLLLLIFLIFLWIGWWVLRRRRRC